VTAASDVRPAVTRLARPSTGLLDRVLHDPQAWVGLGLLVLLALWALVGPSLRPWGATHVDVLAFGQGPSAQHWFGTDDIGQDVYQQVLVGLRKSLAIAVVAAPAGTLLAAVVGAVAGLAGGWADRVLMVVVDLMLTVPAFFLLVLASPGWPVPGGSAWPWASRR